MTASPSSLDSDSIDLTRATVSEAAEALGKSIGTIRRWCDEGRLSYFREPRTKNRRVNVIAYLEGQDGAEGFAEAKQGTETVRLTGVLKGAKSMGGRAWVCVECDVPVSAVREVTKPSSLQVAMAHTEAVLLDAYEIQMGREPRGEH